MATEQQTSIRNAPYLMTNSTVEGELHVARFLVNYFNEVRFWTPVTVHTPRAPPLIIT
jgi:hypothetical protein